jgi:hypothetical protein
MSLGGTWRRLNEVSKPVLPVRNASLVILISVVLAINGASAWNPSRTASPEIRLAIPIDADSPAIWSKAIAGAPSVGIIILNPANGPGEGPNSTSARLVGDAQARGIRVLGYVYTLWADGNVSIEQAERWVDQYYSWYHVDGIMLDEANDSCDPTPLHFYRALYDYIKAEPGPDTVMLNPGEATGQCYAAISDVLLTFENDYTTYSVGYVGSNWTSGYPPSRFFHIVFQVPSAADMEDVISTAAERGAGWVYVTNLNDSSGNPYSSLPNYFGQEVGYVEQLDDAPHAWQAAMPMLLILGLTAAGSAVVVVGARKKAPE